MGRNSSAGLRNFASSNRKAALGRRRPLACADYGHPQAARRFPALRASGTYRSEAARDEAERGVGRRGHPARSAERTKWPEPVAERYADRLFPVDAAVRSRRRRPCGAAGYGGAILPGAAAVPAHGLLVFTLDLQRDRAVGVSVPDPLGDARLPGDRSARPRARAGRRVQEGNDRRAPWASRLRNEAGRRSQLLSRGRGGVGS